MTKSEIHRMLHNPIYAGDFAWNGKMYRGRHETLISHELFDTVQDVFKQSNRPKYTKHRHAFAGLITCARCDCAMTAEMKKGRYVYYHCTGFRGLCGNTYVREEELSRLFAEVVARVQISADVAEQVAQALRESQADKEQFHRASVMRLQQRHLAVQGRLDRAYDDRLAGKITDELWQRRSREWEAELTAATREMDRYNHASHHYAVTGLRILELAKDAPSLFATQIPSEQARLLRTLVSNCTFDRGSLSVTYIKPFDLLVRGNESGDWLSVRDDFCNWVVSAA